MERVRKSITMSEYTAKEIENARFIDIEVDFSNRVEYLCRSAMLINRYGRMEVNGIFEIDELHFVFTCLRGFIPTSQVNPVLEVHSIVCQYDEISSCSQAFDVDFKKVSEKILKLSVAGAFALIGWSQSHWNAVQESPDFQLIK